MTRDGRSSKRVPPPDVPGNRKMVGNSMRSLTLPAQSVALPDNVRALLDWLIDEELKRWQREEQ